MVMKPWLAVLSVLAGLFFLANGCAALYIGAAPDVTGRLLGFGVVAVLLPYFLGVKRKSE